jgi:hypothetical protein
LSWHLDARRKPQCNSPRTCRVREI